jgi:hypothetical protein
MRRYCALEVVVYLQLLALSAVLLTVPSPHANGMAGASGIEDHLREQVASTLLGAVRYPLAETFGHRMERLRRD